MVYIHYNRPPFTCYRIPCIAELQHTTAESIPCIAGPILCIAVLLSTIAESICHCQGMSWTVRVMMYRDLWREQLMVILDQCNGGISDWLMTIMLHAKVRCTQVVYIYGTLVRWYPSLWCRILTNPDTHNLHPAYSDATRKWMFSW